MMKSIHLKSFLAGMGACIGIFLCAGAGWQSEEIPGRYQIVTGSTASSVFVLDTKTGAVAKFYLDDFGTDNKIPAQTVQERLKSTR